MAEINKHAREKQQDFIVFLEEVLNVCISLREKCNLEHKHVYFTESALNKEWLEAFDEEWIRLLCSAMYHDVGKVVRKLGIDFSKSENAEDEANITPRFCINIRDKVPDITDLENRVKKQMDALQNTFVSEDVMNLLKRNFNRFFSNRRNIQQKECVFDLKKEETDNYLDSYYELLGSFIRYYDDLEPEKRNRLICELLHADAEFDKESGEYNISFWSPIVLSKLQKVIKGIEKFCYLMTCEQKTAGKAIWMIYKYTLLAKARNIFRWYMPGDNRELFHAAIAPYVESKNYNLKFQVNARDIKTYSSYEGVGELRLGEKITYEYGLVKGNQSFPFMVAIIGDLNIIPLKELHRYVLNKICRGKEVRPSIVFHVYTKNVLKIDNSVSDDIKYCGKPETVLLKKDELGHLIDTHNVVFILDCIELYKSRSAVRQEDIGFLSQRYTYGHSGEYSSGCLKEVDICESNALEELYEVLTGECCYGQLGKIEKHANEQLLNFCEERVNKAKGIEEKAVYVYVSDLKAFENIYNDDQYYVRTERYNQKEIGIIRYSTEQISALPMGGAEDKMIVFSMWQFIKYVAISERENLAQILGAENEDYLNFGNVFIGMDYTEWPRKILIHYYIADSKEKNNLCLLANKLIDDILIPALNNKSGDMFNTYIKKTMQSFFYSVAKNVNDMLFIHLFQDKQELLGKIVRAEKNNEGIVEKNINIKYRHSSKRFYDMVMKNYDISSDNYIGQSQTAQIIMNNALHNSLIKKNKIYKNVIAACHNLSYDNGYLIRNCTKEL